MKLSGLMSRTRSQAPGLAGVARVDRRTENLLRRIKAGEIAVLDQVDLDRATADALVSARVLAVVNAAPSISGRFPNLGPGILVDAGITLVDGVGSDALHTIKDGARIRLHDGAVYAGERKLAEGAAQDADSVADSLVEAKAGLTHQLEAFAANTTEFMQRERQLLLDGDGVPDVEVELANRQVLVVAAGYDHVADLASLRHYIREYQPVLVGVGAGADALLAAGHSPDLVVADPGDVSDTALTCGADVVVPAQPDGYAAGLARVQDLGVGAITFPSSANEEDLALLLAAHHGAALVVTVGLSATMTEFLDRGRSGSNASTFLTRLQLGGALVDGRVIALLYRSRISAGAILLLVVAGAVAVLAALAVTDLGDALLAWLTHTAGSLAATVVDTVRGWFT
ncbi:MAG: putative cytokinetic ring protein SteA [Pseudonocardia sp.]|nr:putative cytokinetic ring protein SteA [Pseudonocardia sp.]